MSQLSRGIFGAIAVSLTFGAALAAGRDLAEIQNPAGNSQVVNTSEAINRAAKADRADGAVASAVAAFERDPLADVVYGDADVIDAEDRFIAPYPTEEWSLDRLKVVCFLCQPAVFVRRRVLDQFGPFDVKLRHCMDYEYWLRLGMHGLRFVHIPVRMAASRLHPATKTLGSPREVHTEINDMLKEHIGTVPDSWLSNYAYAVLDGRGVARRTSRDYLAHIALLTVGAAFRWNGFPSVTLLRALAWSFLHGSSLVPRRIAFDA